MEMLDYVESRAGKTLAVLRQSYDDLHERAYKLATVLVAGGGATGAYALGKVGAAEVSMYAWAPVAALALSWFGVAATLVWQGATTTDLSAGVGPASLIENYDYRVDHGAAPDAALAGTRRQDMEMEQHRIDAFSAACVARAVAIDRAYRCAALGTPLVPMVVALFCHLWQ